MTLAVSCKLLLLKFSLARAKNERTLSIPHSTDMLVVTIFHVGLAIHFKAILLLLELRIQSLAKSFHFHPSHVHLLRAEEI